MTTPATRAFAAEIDAALDRLDVPALEREYWAQDEFLFIRRFLPAAGVGALLALYRSERFRRFLSDLVGAPLQRCPEEDPHACALYFYTEPGDHMGYHYDTSYYRGARYTVLVGLVQDSASRLRCRLHTRQPGRAPVDLEVATDPGTMVIFNGDKVYHGVSPSRAGDRRIVFSMEYVTSQEMGRLWRLFSNLKDAFAYFGVGALWRGRSRGARTAS